MISKLKPIDPKGSAWRDAQEVRRVVDELVNTVNFLELVVARLDQRIGELNRRVQKDGK